MSTSKQGTNPTLYLTTEKFNYSNQQHYYSNNNLEHQRKQDEQIDQLADNFEKLNNEIREAIRNHQRLKQTVFSTRILQNNLNQYFKKQIKHLEEIVYKFDEVNQDLSEKISKHESVHHLLSNQLNEQEDKSKMLSELIHRNEIDLSNQLAIVKIELLEQRTLKDKQNDFIQDLFEQISQHERIHDLFNTKLDEQKESSQRISEQIHQNETELTKQLANDNKIKRMMREHQLLKIMIDSYQLMQNNINQDLKKQITQHEENFIKLDKNTEDNQNEQNESSERAIEQFPHNRIAHLLSHQLDPNYKSIQEVKKQLGKYESMLSEQFPANDEMIQSPFALILNILPSYYPAKSIFVNGKLEKVTAFLSVNNEEKTALFLDGEKIKRFDYCSIEGITLGEEEW